MLIEILNKAKTSSGNDGAMHEAISCHFSNQDVQILSKDMADLVKEKRYNTRQSAKVTTQQKEQQPRENNSSIDCDSLEEDIISSSDTESNELFETVEKRQVKVNYMKAATESGGACKVKKSKNKKKTMNVSIIQLNCRSINCKLGELKF